MKHYLPLLIACAVAGACAKQHKELRVATYNLRMDTPYDSGNTWKYRSENVKALIAYHDFDLVGTQEGYLHQLLNVCELADYAYVGAGRDDGRKAGEHSAIIYKTSRLEVLRTGNFWLSETPDTPSKGWDARCCNRICSWAQFKDKHARRTFYAFNVHFDHEGVVARRESGTLIAAKITEIAGNAPVVCTGDFNSTDTSAQIKTMAALLHDARTAAISPPYGPAGTFNTRFRNPVLERIDYIFVSDAFQVLRYATLTDNNGRYYPSDHLPAAAVLQW